MSFLRQLVDEINRVRENPKSFIPHDAPPRPASERID